MCLRGAHPSSGHMVRSNVADCPMCEVRASLTCCLMPYVPRNLEAEDQTKQLYISHSLTVQRGNAAAVMGTMGGTASSIDFFS